MKGSNSLVWKLRTIWNRITFSRLTVIYFCFTLLHFAAQIAVQSTAFNTNIVALDDLERLIVNKSSLDTGFPIMQGSVLKVCTWVPSSIMTDGSACTVIWNDAGPVTNSNMTSVNTGSTSKAPPSAETQDSDGESALASGLLQGDPSTARLAATFPNATCQASLVWPISVLKDQKREDFTFLAFQVWVLGMSIVALLNESIPHVFASLLTHMMSTGWAAFQITDTASFHSDFHRVIVQSTCKGVQVLPNVYWSTRAKADLAGLILNAVALLISSYLTWKMTKLFGWQTFKRIGASLVMNRIYRLALLLSIAIQLCLFFVSVTVSLWIDRLVNGHIGDLAGFRTLYLASSGVTLVLLVPWLILGWVGVRRERRMSMFFFLLLAILYIGCSSTMFLSTTFRWTFITWRFFSLMASASFLLTCIAFILGIICRCNFGKGLARYLNPPDGVEDPKPYSPSYVEEKLNFPSEEWAVPTYTSQFQFPIDKKTVPQFDDLKATKVISTLPPRSDSLRHPPLAYDHRRNRSDVPLMSSQASLGRSTSGGSSHSSASSLSSCHDSDGGHYNKRWVIE